MFLLADIDLEVVIALVDADHLVLIHLVTCPTEQLASLLDALQSIGGDLPLLVSSQGPVLPGGNGARPGAILREDGVEHGCALGGGQHGAADAQQAARWDLVCDPANRLA